jgi:hypothetical protein
MGVPGETLGATGFVLIDKGMSVGDERKWSVGSHRPIQAHNDAAPCRVELLLVVNLLCSPPGPVVNID